MPTEEIGTANWQTTPYKPIGNILTQIKKLAKFLNKYMPTKKDVQRANINMKNC